MLTQTLQRHSQILKESMILRFCSSVCHFIVLFIEMIIMLSWIQWIIMNVFVTFLFFQNIEYGRFLSRKIDHVDFARIPVWKFNAFLSQCLVILHYEWELCLVHHESIVPKLNQVQHFLLNLHFLGFMSASIKTKLKSF